MVQSDDPSQAEGAAEGQPAAKSTQQDGGAEQAAAPQRVRFDPRELRRIIALSFSAGELSKLAERWHVHTDREGRLDDAARTLVRALEARDALPALIDALREAKPLVEWPEPVLEPVPAAPPEPGEPAPDEAEAQSDPTGGAGAGGVGEAAKARASASVGKPLVDPFLEDQLRHEEDDEGWPSWTRWAAIAGVLVVGIGVGAVVMYALSGDDTPSPSSGEAVEPAGVARLAADQLRVSVQAVVEACEVEPEDSVRDTLTTAFQRCALPPMRPGPVNVPIPTRRAEPPSAPPRGQPATRPRQPSRSAACLDRCHQGYGSCQQSECGPEPQSASDFDSYQRCMSGCMAKYSRCRLACR